MVSVRVREAKVLRGVWWDWIWRRSVLQEGRWWTGGGAEHERLGQEEGRSVLELSLSVHYFYQKGVAVKQLTV